MRDRPAELRSLLARFRAGRIPEEAVYALIHDFGEAACMEAKPDVEALLTHPDPELRYIALNVLTLHWMCSEHRRTCEEFALEDADSENRGMGVAGLGALLRGTRDPEALALLLRIFRNEGEEWLVRDSAYCSILYVLGRPASEQPPATRRLDHTRDVDWDRIREAEDLLRSSDSWHPRQSRGT